MTSYQRISRQECSICPPLKYLEDQVTLPYHKHFSSRAARLDCQGVYDCPTCNRSHSPRIGGSLSVCVCASTLHEFWAPWDESVTFTGCNHHVDYMSLPGATIQEMRSAFFAEYGDACCGLNVLLIPGYNDMMRGSEVPEIMREIGIFQDLVELQAYRNHPATPNTFGVSTMPYPPRLCRMPGQSARLPDFEDYFPQQHFINRQLTELNALSHLPSLDFSCLGLKWERNEQGVMVAIPDFAKWREMNPRRMLHLNDAVRIRMARQVERYFVALQRDEV